MAARKIRTQTPGIYKRGSRYVFPYKVNGRQRWESAKTLAEARRKKAARQADIARGEFHEASRVPFREYAEEWIERYGGRRGRGFRESTREDYKRDLRRYAFPFFDERRRRRLAQVTPRDIAEFIAWLCDEPEQGRRLAEEKRARKAEERGVLPHTLALEVKPLYLADATIRRILSPLRACLATAVEEGEIRTNPTVGANVPHRDEQRAIDAGTDEDQEEIKAFTLEQLGKFLRVCHPRWLPFFQLLAATGMRVSEAFALRWRDLELDGSAPRVHVRRAYVRGRFGPPKSKYGRRSIPLDYSLAADLVQRRQNSERPGDDDLVFPSSSGQPWHQENVRRRVLKPTAEAAGAPWAGFHTFRHTRATLMLANGRNAVQVQHWLGHHSPAFTLSTYAHLLDNDMGAPADLAAELVGSTRVPTEATAMGLDDRAAAGNGSGVDHAWDGNEQEPRRTEPARS